MHFNNILLSACDCEWAMEPDRADCLRTELFISTWAFEREHYFIAIGRQMRNTVRVVIVLSIFIATAAATTTAVAALQRFKFALSLSVSLYRIVYSFSALNARNTQKQNILYV